MPNWTYTTGSSASIWDLEDDTVMYTLQTWEEYLEEERQKAIKRKQIAEDKMRYPLFFLKEGIV